MCGIVGAIAERKITHILLEGLKRLEYRGYDSAGLAVIDPKRGDIQRVRTIEKVESLGQQLAKKPLSGFIGIAHTRWATHGKPTEINAHPHCSHQQIAVVHNGIIENHETLRTQLIQQGYDFVTETDTEVIAHLLHYHTVQEKHFIKAIHKTTKELHGAYALGIITTETPHTLYAVRRGSPLVIGIGFEEHFIASDPLALLPVTQQFIYLEEGDIAELTISEAIIYDQDLNKVARPIYTSESDLETTSKGHYRHYMQKEIFEQPQAILDTLNGHLTHNALQIKGFGYNANALLSDIKHIHICACGTSFHAGLVARHWIESLAKIPCLVEISSEFRYREPLVMPNTLFVALSQSGETADTLAALHSAKARGYQTTLGICNSAESTLAREADLIFLTRAGHEIGVAATKTFTSQLVALLLLALCLKQIHTPKDMLALIKIVNQLPKLIQETLQLNNDIQTLSRNFEKKDHALFLGRGIHYPIALEGALKLKEISYLHAEAYPAGELKHGPLALVDKFMPVITIAPKNALIEKLESNIQEVQARQGEVYLFTDKSIDWKTHANTHIISMPEVPELLTPIIYTIPLQLLAYHIAVLKGTDVDQPRNLAKSVTVE